MKTRTPRTMPQTHGYPSAVPTPSITADDLTIAGRCRHAWRALRDDAALMARVARSDLKNIVYRLHSEAERSDPLERIGCIWVGLAALGAKEAFFRRQIILLTHIVDDLFAGNAAQCISELDRADLTHEARENALQGERLIDQHATPEELEAEHDALVREISVKTVRARLLLREARRARAGMSTAYAVAG